jgi:protein-tyrosine phosphatase
MSEILKDQLYLGDYSLIVCDTQYFIREKFTHIINVGSEILYSPKVTKLLGENGIEMMKFPMYDREEYNIEKVLSEVLHLMQIVIANKGKVYIHCAMGISRSATIVIAYLIMHQQMSFDEAYEWVKARRSWICPNPRFMKDLIGLKYNTNDSHV